MASQRLTDSFISRSLILDDSALNRLLGGLKKTPLRDGLRQSLEAVRRP